MSLAPIKILLIQDKRAATKTLTEALSRLGASGFGCETVPSLPEAIERFQAKKFDVVILDLDLHGSKGFDTLTSLQTEVPDSPIVVLGGLDDELQAAGAVRAGAQDYLVKSQIGGRSLIRRLRMAIERHSASEALRDSEERHRALLNAIPDMIFRLSEGGRFLEFMPSREVAPMVSPPEFLGKRIHDILPREAATLSTRFMEAALTSGETQVFEYAIPVNDVRRYYESRLIPYRDGEVLGIVRDVTERKSAAEALRESEARFRTMFDAAVVGMALVDLGGRPHESNSSLQKMLGYRGEELRRMVFTEFTHPEDAATDMNLYKELVEGVRDHYELDKRYLRKDGVVVWGHLNVSVQRGSDGVPQHVIAMVEDITERKKTEDALRTSEEQLRQAQKMEAIGRLAGGVAHDFNNLLTAILGYTQFVLEELDEQSPLRADLLDVQKNGRRAAALTRQLLAFSRRQVLQPEVLNLNKIVANISKMLGRLIGEDIELLTLPDAELGNAKADPGQVEQVIVNLCVNSRDAMPSGGRITIKTNNVMVDEKDSLAGGLVKPGRYVLLEVSDNGEGMDSETRSRVFEPFFTTKELGKGTGLGLSTVFGIVKQSGGYIWVRSEVGKGTAFKVCLPRVDESETRNPRSGNYPRPATSQGVETILLAEDEESVRTMTRRILEKGGYHVLEARDGAEGADLSDHHAGSIDLVVTDLVMPQLNGPQMMERIFSKRPDTRVLYLSGYTEEALLKSLDPDAPFVQKPFTAKQLSRRVRDLLYPEMEGEP